MRHAFLIEEDAIGLAQSQGVLTSEEAFALEALADTDDPVPEWLGDAVERLFLWCVEADNNIH